MSNITPTVYFRDNGQMVIKWPAVTEADTGLGVGLPSGVKSLSIQALGDFTSSGAIQPEGSNDGGVTWAQLGDIAGTAISFTAAGIKCIGTIPERIRVRATAGSSVSMDVWVCVNR